MHHAVTHRLNAGVTFLIATIKFECRRLITINNSTTFHGQELRGTFVTFDCICYNILNKRILIFSRIIIQELSQKQNTYNEVTKYTTFASLILHFLCHHDTSNHQCQLHHHCMKNQKCNHLSQTLCN